MKLIKPYPAHVYSQWQRNFSAEAKADNYKELRRHIEYLDLHCTPADFLKGTEMLLYAVLQYYTIDNIDYTSFIRQQRYHLSGEGLPFYCLTFQLTIGHYGRVLANNALSDVDFADLFNHPWDKYKTAGFHQVWISRLDGKPISKKEYDTLDHLVRGDMYVDYEEEEVDVYVNMTELSDTVSVIAQDTDTEL